MIKRGVYICEGCGKEFDDWNKCNLHEAKCTNKHLKYKKNVDDAVNRILIDYGSIIIGHSIRVDEEVESYHCYADMEIYKFEIDIKLSNGNGFTIYDGFDEELYLGNYLESEAIYTSLKREIENRLSLKYEGVLHSDMDDGWRVDKIGAVELSDIVDRLDGRKVSIKVVEDSDSNNKILWENMWFCDKLRSLKEGISKHYSDALLTELIDELLVQIESEYPEIDEKLK